MWKPWLEKLILMLIAQVLTPEAMKEAKEDFIAWLRIKAKESTNTLDDAGVELLATFLGVK